MTGREPEATGKPSALAMRLVAQRLGLDPSEVGVVGDDPIAEMEMAREGGAIGIAVTSGSTSRAQWETQPAGRQPHHLIASVTELGALLPG